MKFQVPRLPREVVRYETGIFIAAKLKECLERVREPANFNGVSHFAMPRIGCVDDRLEWINAGICKDSIFQDSHCTVSVYTPEDEMERYPEVNMTQRHEGSAADFCAAVTPEEMLATESVTERISLTKIAHWLNNKN